MPLIEHFRELRSRVVKSALVIALTSVVGWFFFNEIITQLAKPVCDLKFAQETGAESCGALYISGVLGPLNLQIKVLTILDQYSLITKEVEMKRDLSKQILVL